MWDDYERCLQDHINLIKSPHCQIDISGLDVMLPNAAEYTYVEYANVLQILKKAATAQRSGYDAYILGCITDPGHDVVRSALGIPTIFSGETAMHMAGLIGKKFAFIARTKRTANRLNKNIEAYGLAAKSIPSVSMDVTFEDIAAAFKDSRSVLAKFFSTCEWVMDQGAEVVIPGCGVLNVLLVANRVSDYKGLVLLDTLGVCIKVAEALIELGRKNSISIARLGDYRTPEREVGAAVEKVLTEVANKG
jgi:allantoin racemase